MSFLDRLKSVLGGSSPSGPPSPREVAGRAYALNALILYAKTVAASGVMPGKLRSMNQEQVRPVVDTAAAVAARIVGAAKKFGFIDLFSPNEAALLSKPFDKIDDQQLVAATWRTEAFQVLLWALVQIENLPSLDEQAGDDLFKLLKLEEFNQFGSRCELRDTGTIESAREVAELWHWRSRTRQCIEENQPFPKISTNPGAPELTSFDDVVRLTARGLRETGLAVEAIDEDFKVKGKAFRDLSRVTFSSFQRS
jgi:hypothetical protein